MTELREPPLLSDKDIRKVWGDRRSSTCGIVDCDRDLIKAQGESDIKWMKEHCYIKAERELPDLNLPTLIGNRSLEVTMESFAKKIRTDMLKEVDGVSFKAVRRWE